ncbi:MAG: type II/IV secretion system ATPase subunit [Candidatus Altiarchaeota archaeon]|nr:type II/IV secretion system ATPase subunit [Candidatus Altiarchaeota archaeon]
MKEYTSDTLGNIEGKKNHHSKTQPYSHDPLKIIEIPDKLKTVPTSDGTGSTAGGTNPANPINPQGNGGLTDMENLIREVVSDLDIKDTGLLCEVLEELTSTDQEMKELLGDVDSIRELLSVEASVSKTSSKVKTNLPLMEYEPAEFQKVTVKPYETELMYEISEPYLADKEQKNIEFIKNIFDRLIGIGDIVVMEDLESKREYLKEKFDEILSLYNIKFKDPLEKEKIFYFIQRDSLKYGKLDVMMNDKYIEDISCNGSNMPIYIYHRHHGSIKTNLSFTEVELNDYVLRLSQLCGKHISILNPITDASLPDGSRINITLGSEVTRKGSTFTIRKFKKIPLSPLELADFGTVDSNLLAYLWLLLDHNMSLLISGGTASGKTTLLNAICMFVKPPLKIVSIEDTPEINLEHPNWLQSITRTGFGQQHAGGGISGISGLSGISPTKSSGDIGLYDLLVAALRQRPDYIIVGEVRGSEAFTMFQAIAVGHACMGTIHARNMSELLGRVESVPMNVPRTLFSNVDIVTFVTQIKTEEGTVRRVMEVVEVLELEPETKGLITNPVFRWNGENDTFENVGRFMLFDKIAEEFGIAAESLIEEHKKRSDFLHELKKNNVKNHIEFTRKIMEYYGEFSALKRMSTDEGESLPTPT